MRKSFLLFILFCLSLSDGIAQKILLDGSEYNKLQYDFKNKSDSLTMLNVLTSGLFISFEVVSVNDVDVPIGQVTNFKPDVLEEAIAGGNLFIEREGQCFRVNHMRYYTNVRNGYFKAHNNQASIPEINLKAQSKQNEKSPRKNKNEVIIEFENSLYLDSVKNIYCFKVYNFTQVSATTSGIVKFSFSPDIGFVFFHYVSYKKKTKLRSINNKQIKNFIEEECCR